MLRRKSFFTGASIVFGWALLGGLLGLGAGYWAYVKTPALFAAVATIQMASSPRQTSEENAEEHRATVDESIPTKGTALDAPLTQLSTQDDSHLLISDDVLSQAVKLGRLRLLPEDLRRDLQARRIADSSGGAVYEIQYRGATPSSAKETVSAVVTSCQQTLSKPDNAENRQESIRLLTTVRAEIDQRVEQLQSQLREIEVTGDAVLYGQDQRVISATAEQWQKLRSEAYRLQQRRSALMQTLTRVESLVREGASSETVLAMFGLGGNMTEDLSPERRQELDRQAAARELEQRQRLQTERANLVLAVERELAPLQSELNDLLKKYGAEHPAVRHVRSQITTIRSKLDAIPPLKPVTTKNNTVKPGDSTPTTNKPEDEKEQAKQIVILVRAARMEKQILDKQLLEVSAQLSTAAGQLAQQEQALRQQRQLQLELNQQQELREQTIARLRQLPVTSPSGGARLTVLQSASRGQQVSPMLMPYLATGGGTGLLAGFILGCLLLAYAASPASGISPAAETAA